MAVSEEKCSSAKSRASASNNHTHYLAKCMLRGSVVLQVVYGHIRSSNMLDVVFGKETSIELVMIGEDGIVQSVCEQPVFGIIKDLAILPWNEKSRPQNQQLVGLDFLIVTSDSGKLSFLYFCNEMHRFFAMTQVQLSNPGNSRNQLGRMLAVDSSGCYIATSAYENQFVMFSISVSARSDIIDKKIVYSLDTEGDIGGAKNAQNNRTSSTIWSMCFISKDPIHQSKGHNPLLAILQNSLVNDGLLVQIHQQAVKLCLPTKLAHCEGIPLLSPVCTTWFPDNMNINLGAVGHDQIVVSTSNPCIFFILGVRLLYAYHYEIYEMQHLSLQYELSCVSIPPKYHERRSRNHHKNMVDTSHLTARPHEVDISKYFVVGTHKPLVEILSFDPDEGLKLLAIGTITLTNTLGTPVSSCIPQDVRIVLVDRFYILSGLRNGMLLRFEWPGTLGFLANASSVLSSVSTQEFFGLQLPKDVSMHDFPVNLQVIAIRRIGITPVFLVTLSNSLDTDIIALSDRPWLLHTARHGLSDTSISFQSSTHVTAVCSVDCPKGILFVADSSLHLPFEETVFNDVEIIWKLSERTPRKVLYHNESKLLLVLRTDLTYDTCSSDVCCLDPLSGVVLSSFKFDLGETGKSMKFVRAGNEKVLIIGTSLSSGPVIMPSGEAVSTKGRLIVLCLEHVQNSDTGSLTLCSKAWSFSQRSSPLCEVAGYAAEQLSSSSLCSSADNISCEGSKFGETDVWQLRLSYSVIWPEMVVAICPYLDGYFLASAGNAFYICGFSNDNSHRVRKFAVARTRFMITSLTTHFTRIAVGDCRDGILFYSYHEDARKLEQVYCDPLQRLVADCILMDIDTAVVSDRKGSIAVLSWSNYLEDNASPECILTVSCAYFVGEIAMSIRKGSFSYKLPADDVLRGSNVNLDLLHNTIITSTLLGSIITYIPLSSEEYELLEAVQARLVVHPLTAPILGNDHNEFHGREHPIEVPKMLDGDMLTQFLELTSIQQEAVLSFPLGTKGIPRGSWNLFSTISVNQVVQLLERVHYAMN